MPGSYKTILIGDSNVGKRHLICRLFYDSFDLQDYGDIRSAFLVKQFDVNGKKLKLQVWETFGQERFRDLPPMYYRDAKGAYLVYDITKRESFENLAKWLEQAREKGHRKMSIVLVGNKSDLGNERVVSYEEGEKFAKENGLVFIETSCKTAYNVKEAFGKMAESINEKLEAGVFEENKIPKRRLLGPQNDDPNIGSCTC